MVLFCGGIIFIHDGSKSMKTQVVSYNGNNLMIHIDGDSSVELPTTGTYYLTNYQCDNPKTIVTWNRVKYELTVSNGKDGGSVACDLTFQSKPLLSDMAVGSYVAYKGTGGVVGSEKISCQIGGNSSSEIETEATEAPNSCLGQNAREDLDNSNYTYGYCSDKDYRYYTTGWRIAYVDSVDEDNPKAVIVSAGSPECNERTASITNVDYIQNANTKALKYCNKDYVDGDCICLDDDVDGLCDRASVDAWAVSDIDFYQMALSISGAENWLADCEGNPSLQSCGYHNDLIDNGGFYWFSSSYHANSMNGMMWSPIRRMIENTEKTFASGLRPVIGLSSTVYVTGGSGTMNDPYTIANS